MKVEMVRGGAARDQVRCLCLAGWPLAELSRRTGYAPHVLRQIADGREWIKAEVAFDIGTVAVQLEGQRGPDIRAEARARRLGWHFEVLEHHDPLPQSEVAILDAQVHRCDRCGWWVLPDDLMAVPHVHRPLADRPGLVAA